MTNSTHASSNSGSDTTSTSGANQDERSVPSDSDARSTGVFGLELLPDAGSLSALEFVHRHLYDAIMACRVRPGTRLREQALAEIFSVGRTTIRSALQRLSVEGAVELRPNRGALVAIPGAEELREVIDARRVIECELIQRAARYQARQAGARANLALLEHLAAEEGAHLAAGRRGAATRLAGDFHVELARLGGNSALAESLVRLVTRSALGVAAYERAEQSYAGWRSRLDLIEVIATGDSQASCNTMAAHLAGLEASLDLDGAPRPDSALAAAFEGLPERVR